MPRDWKVVHDRRAEVADETTVLYATVGDGEPVLLIHGAHMADSVIGPFMLYPEVFEGYELVSYYRAGYSGSSWPRSPTSMLQQAEHGIRLLQHLGIAKAHVVGHSFAGLIAIQMAISFPDAVHTAVLLEPFLPRSDPATVRYYADQVDRAVQLHREGHKRAALEAFLQFTAGPNILSAIDLTCPLDSWDNGSRDVDAFFAMDMPALQTWDFDPTHTERLERPTMPVLAAMGMLSEAACPGFREGQQFLLSWLPQAERLGVENATHGMQIMNPRGIAEGCVAFLKEHPISKPS